MAKIKCYVDIDLYKYVNEINTETLKNELEYRGFFIHNNQSFVIVPQDDPEFDVKRQICDFLGISYHTKKEDILKLLGSKFRD